MKEIDWSKAPEWATHAVRKLQNPNKGSIQWSILDENHEHRVSPGGLWFNPCGYEVAGVRPKDVSLRPWSGEGLPPVGTVCEAWHSGSHQGEVTVLFIGKQTAVLRNHSHGDEQHGALASYKFRPIRTPEQIAAEEREKAVSEMAVIALAGDNDLINTAWLGRLYDAGYRKQVTP